MAEQGQHCINLPDSPKNPVILLGGLANTVSVIRSFSRAKIPVYLIASRKSPALKSKYLLSSFPVPEKYTATEYFNQKLITEDSFPHDSVIFPCEDEAIQFVAANKNKLREKFILDIQDPQHQLDLLDKKKTLSLALKAGCMAPGYWEINNINDVENCVNEVKFPVLIKPIHSHIFQRQFNSKLIQIEDTHQLLKTAKQVLDVGVPFMLCEFIPGSDELLSSYYVYIDEDEKVLFEFTKKVIRRSPPNFGGGCYHITEWLPKTAEMGYRFFSSMGFKGMGNIEFKTDLQDGQLKVIECNARFTGAQELVTRSGMDMALIIYNYLTAAAKPKATGYLDNITLWLPLDDFDSFRSLRKRGELTFIQWFKSIFRTHVFCYFDWRDPGPFIESSKHELGWRVKSVLQKILKIFRKMSLFKANSSRISN